MNENKTIIERGAVCRVAIHGQISGSVFKCDNISDIIPTTYLGGGGGELGNYTSTRSFENSKESFIK